MKCLLVIAALTLPQFANADAVAIIVTYNGSGQLNRPELHYADDDGAKYYQLFTKTLGADNVFLHARFDSDTKRLYPNIRPLAPTRKALNATVKKVQTMLRQRPGTDFYFVYAGHGDEHGGKGFLQLQGSRFSAHELRKLIGTLAFRNAHVILDACNSYFSLFPRKAGGKRFVASAEVFASKQLPKNVGVFLSTSADEEVYEWSALQSGIFSYAVRSGLTGAADVDRDGHISYAELSSFVSRATAPIPNPTFRPQIFVRGPNGSDQSALLALPRLARSIEAPAGAIARIRDANGIPWASVNTESNFRPTIVLPSDEKINIELETKGSKRHLIAAAGTTSLTPISTKDQFASRSLQDSLKKMFTQPFGPSAHGKHLIEVAARSPEILGVSRRDLEQMDLMLHHTSELDRHQRDVESLTALSGGVLFIGMGAWRLSSDLFPSDADKKISGYSSIGLGAVLVGYSAYLRFSDSPGEKLYQRFAANRTQLSPSLAVEIENRLFWMAKRDRRIRHTGAWVTGISSAVTIGILVGNEFYTENEETKKLVRYMGAPVAIISAAAAVYLVSHESPVERMVSLWQNEREPTRITIIPMAGGAGIGAFGRF